jgi:hypothetical protein
MDLTKMSLDEFLCNSMEDVEASPNAFAAADGAFDLFVGEAVRTLRDGYALHRMADQLGNALLLHEGAIVGFYVGEVLAISTAHTGKSLSVPMILEAVKHRSLPKERKLSLAGRKALTKAWNVANRKVPDPWP